MIDIPISPAEADAVNEIVRLRLTTKQPTWRPRNEGEMWCYFDGSTYYLYVYENGAWRVLTLATSSGSGIAFDSANNTPISTVGTSATLTHTATGSNLIALIYTFVEGGDWLTSLKYSGTTATLVAKVNIPAKSAYIYTHYVVGIPTGASNVVTTVSSSTLIMSACTTYTGAKQSGQPDAFATATGSAVSSLTQSVTTVANKAWLHTSFGSGDTNTGINPTGGANTILRLGVIDQNVATWRVASGDTNAQETPAGSYSQTVNLGNTDNAAIIVTSIAPA